MQSLLPEESRAWTVGFVAQPVRSFSFGIDYWSYEIKDAISVIGDQTIFGDPVQYASLFVRCSQAPAARQAALGACQNPGGVDPLAYVINTNQNLGEVQTSGLDLQANWQSEATRIRQILRRGSRHVRDQVRVPGRQRRTVL